MIETNRFHDAVDALRKEGAVIYHGKALRLPVTVNPTVREVRKWIHEAASDVIVYGSTPQGDAPMNVAIRTRVTEEMADKLKTAAEDAGVSVSELIREGIARVIEDR